MANKTVYPYGTEGSLPSSIGLVNDYTTGGVNNAETAEAVKNFYSEVFGAIVSDNFTKDDATIVQTQSGSVATVGSRIRVILQVQPGDQISTSCSLGKGAAASIYSTLSDCYNSGSNYIQTLHYNYTLDPISGTANVSGYLCVSMCKSDSSNFTTAEFEQYVAALQFLVARPHRAGGALGVTGPLTKAVSVPFDVPGWVNRSTGIVTMNASYLCSGLIKIDTAATYYIQGVFGTNGGLCVFYDENRDYLGAYDETGLTSPASIAISKEHGIPSGAEYMRITGSIDYGYCFKVGGSDKNEYDGWTELPITTLVNKTTNSSGLYQDSTTRVSIASTYAIPYPGAKLKFKLPPFIGCWIYSGHNASGSAIEFSNSNGWFNDGDEFAFLQGDIYFRFVFGYRNHMPVQSGDTNYELSVADINAFIASGQLAIYYKEDEDVVLANTDCEKYVRAAMRKFTTVRADDADLDVFPKFVHTSDVHGDVIRTNRFADYADHLGVDAALISGDMVAYRGLDRMFFVNSIANRHTTPVYICMGNHDNGKFGDYNTAQAQYESIMGYLIDKNGCSTPSGEDYPTYYYKDFTAKKIRLIALNSYEEGRNVTNSSNCFYSQDQIDWLVSTLASTPQNYGVILMYHSPESTIEKDVNRAAFFQNSSLVDSQSDSITGYPLVKIIDAFITKSAVSGSFTEKNSSNNTITITYSADFSSLASGVEFIAHICGHEHSDFVGYYANASSRQLVLNVTCGNCLYGTDYLGLAHLSDLPRGGVGVTQDSFNFYAIDRARGVVKVARIGSNTNFDGQDRKFAVMPYKD